MARQDPPGRTHLAGRGRRRAPLPQCLSRPRCPPGPGLELSRKILYWLSCPCPWPTFEGPTSGGERLGWPGRWVAQRRQGDWIVRERKRRRGRSYPKVKGDEGLGRRLLPFLFLNRYLALIGGINS
jgi:hypothetical protein